MKRLMKILLCCLLFPLALSACPKDDGPLENAGENADDAIENIGDNIEDATD